MNENCAINPCITEDYPSRAKRPAFSVLDTSKIQQALGINLPFWKENVKYFIHSAHFDKIRVQ